MNFSDQSADESSTESETTTSENKFFDERSPIHEMYWVACDANRRNGPQILNNPDLHTKNTDAGVSGVVDDYRFFQQQKKELIEEITGERDMYGLRKYREDFPEPSPEMWQEEATEHYGITITGIHKIPAEEALERFDVDYSDDGVDPIYVPILEDPETGEEVVYDPDDWNEGHEPEQEAESEPEPEPEPEAEAGTDEGTESEPDFPADPDTVMSYLEEQPLDGLTKQAKATLHKLRDPSITNDEASEMADCSKNTVRKGLQKYLGEEGYEDLKERSKKLRSSGSTESTEPEPEPEPEPSSEAESYEEKMGATAEVEEADEADETEKTVEVKASTLATLQARVNRLESIFADDLLEDL